MLNNSKAFYHYSRIAKQAKKDRLERQRNIQIASSVSIAVYSAITKLNNIEGKQ